MTDDPLDGSTRPSLVAVVAHPDDEVLIAGGTLALAARAGTPTGVICLTRGERGPVAAGSLRAGETLADARTREIGDAAGVLGVGWVQCMDRPDGAILGEDAAAIAREVAAYLCPHGPSVLLTFGPDGLYGHPDHVATRRIVIAAARLLTRAPVVLESAWRPGLMTELVAAAAARDLPVDLWGLEPESFGAPRASVLVTIDVRRVAAHKVRAFAAHRTQFHPEHLLAALPDDLARQYLGEETWAGAARDLDGAGRLRALLGAA
jgi:N-acetyl-1-D-myo-inositol-2-amino-2-deoxy-alpha-D-glucopyranoside deacetylase